MKNTEVTTINKSSDNITDRSAIISSVLEHLELISTMRLTTSGAETFTTAFKNTSALFTELGERQAARLGYLLDRLCASTENLTKAGVMDQANTLISNAVAAMHSVSFGFLLSGYINENDKTMKEQICAIENFISKQIIPIQIQASNTINIAFEESKRLSSPKYDEKSEEQFREGLTTILDRMSKYSEMFQGIAECATELAGLIDSHYSTTLDAVIDSLQNAHWKTTTPGTRIKQELIKPIRKFTSLFIQKMPLDIGRYKIDARQVGGFLVTEIPMGLLTNQEEDQLRTLLDDLNDIDRLVFQEFRIGKNREISHIACFDSTLSAFTAYEVRMGGRQFLFPDNELITPVFRAELPTAAIHLTCKDLFGLPPKERQPESEADGLLVKIGGDEVFIETESLERPKTFLAQTKEPTRFEKLGFAGVARSGPENIALIWDIFVVVQRWFLKLEESISGTILRGERPPTEQKQIPFTSINNK